MGRDHMWTPACCHQTENRLHLRAPGLLSLPSHHPDCYDDQRLLVPLLRPLDQPPSTQQSGQCCSTHFRQERLWLRQMKQVPPPPDLTPRRRGTGFEPRQTAPSPELRRMRPLAASVWCHRLASWSAALSVSSPALLALASFHFSPSSPGGKLSAQEPSP